MADAPGHKTQEQDEYVFNYDSTITTDRHAGRTAEVSAAFFLPYLKPGMNLLDCGCGPGSITLGLAERIAPGKVVGIDVSEDGVQSARKLAFERGVSNVRFELGSAYDLPFSDNAFDAVFSHNMTEHLNDPLTCFREIWRVLKPGGIVGVRDYDGGGSLASGPKLKLVGEAFDLIHKDWLNVGGTPYMGSLLKSSLRESGFKKVLAWGSYESFPAQESLTQFMDIVASLLEDQAGIERITKSGLADERKAHEYARILREFGGDPDSFYAHAHGEVVAWEE